MEEKILLGLTIGQLRTMMAYMDGDIEIKDWIESYEFQDAYTTYIDENWPDEEDFEEEDEELYEPIECNCDMEDYDDEDEEYDEEEEDEDISTPLFDQEKEEYALQVARDIANGAYTLDDVASVLDGEVFSRVMQLV
jgi:hypothetical protein